MGIALLILFLIISGCDKTSSVSTQTAVDPSSQEHPEQKATKLHEEGKRLFNAGKYKEALDAWLKESELRPGNASNYNNIGLGYGELRDSENAIRYSRKAIEVDPNYAHAYYSLGLALFDAVTRLKSPKERNEASIAFQKAADMNYRPADAYYHLAEIYNDSREWRRALEAIERVIEIEPSHLYRKRLEFVKESCEAEIRNEERPRLSYIYFCDEERKDDLCVEDDAVPIGRLITILSEKK